MVSGGGSTAAPCCSGSPDSRSLPIHRTRNCSVSPPFPTFHSISVGFQLDIQRGGSHQVAR